MNTEKKTNRKEWVKNVAIIFLSIMLVLTFFSNTIMNYSLPEVATAMIEPGSITAKIRGTGNLVSDDPYKITIQESRKIASVAVKQGDVVEKDQILFYLEDEDSAELEQAEKDLNDLILAYSTTLLKGEVSEQSYQNIQGGNVSSNQEYQNKIHMAKQKVESLEATVESLEKQIAITQGSTSTAIDKKNSYDRATLELENAKKKLSEVEGQLDAAKADSKGDITAATTAKYDKEAIFNREKSEFDVVKTTLQTAVTAANNSGVTEALAEAVKGYDDINNINEYIATIDKLYVQIPEQNGAGNNNSTVKSDLATAMHEYQKKYEQILASEIEYETAVNKYNTIVSANAQLAGLQAAVISASNYVNECQAKVNAIQSDMNHNEGDTKKQVESLQLQKIEAESSLKTAQEELTQLLTDISSELNLGNQNSIIREQREKIAKLKENAVGATITAPIAGTITNLYKIAGENITPNEELAVMQPEGKGFSMSFSVTPEQAKKVKVGDAAEIQNSWYYSDITATLVGIRPDPESNGEKKLLVFDVIGDVQAGQSLSLSIGQRSANYDLLVPNSAIREDNNGKFILLVEAKNSPLGNRYIATRVDVEVLGADDNKTAINAPLYGYEYVITTTTQPVEAGKQVRLSEN
ncbi:MAG: HlyD family efflux transporter periplasmic adaptor subunit [Lachnospiraceae bacterium]|nr:HlyD family efflux transporter periplasmic adaptor subunit [Lachnospiraceae bacterium]